MSFFISTKISTRNELLKSENNVLKNEQHELIEKKKRIEKVYEELKPKINLKDKESQGLKKIITEKDKVIKEKDNEIDDLNTEVMHLNIEIKDLCQKWNSRLVPSMKKNIFHGIHKKFSNLIRVTSLQSRLSDINFKEIQKESK